MKVKDLVWELCKLDGDMDVKVLCSGMAWGYNDEDSYQYEEVDWSSEFVIEVRDGGVYLGHED